MLAVPCRQSRPRRQHPFYPQFGLQHWRSISINLINRDIENRHLPFDVALRFGRCDFGFSLGSYKHIHRQNPEAAEAVNYLCVLLLPSCGE